MRARPRPSWDHARRRTGEQLRLVAFGGGTGLSHLLRGFASEVSVDVTAVVAVSDDGGSTGRLRRELGVGAVGDLRACISALARQGWDGLLEHRFGAGPLAGHAVGNLLLAAGWERTQRLSRSVASLSRLVGVRGRVLPATDVDVRVLARLADGRIVTGESSLATRTGPVERMSLQPAACAPGPGVLDAIAAADAIVLGPGSLYTSVVASALAEGVGRALEAAAAPKLYVLNLFAQKGETDELGAVDHIRVLRAHLGADAVDAVLVHAWNGTPPPGAIVAESDALSALGLDVVVARIAAERGHGRHHAPVPLAEAVVRWARGHVRRARVSG